MVQSIRTTTSKRLPANIHLFARLGSERNILFPRDESGNRNKLDNTIQYIFVWLFFFSKEQPFVSSLASIAKLEHKSVQESNLERPALLPRLAPLPALRRTQFHPWSPSDKLAASPKPKRPAFRGPIPTTQLRGCCLGE